MRPIDPDQAKTLVASQRWRDKILVTADGCWLWTGALTKNGYPKIAIDGRKTHRYAHRVALVAHLGRDITGQAGHRCHDEAYRRGDCAAATCDHRRCVNPDHLIEQSGSENRTAGGSGEYPRTPVTECRRGHTFDESNTWIDFRGRRHCRACHAFRAKRRRERLKKGE